VQSLAVSEVFSQLLDLEYLLRRVMDSDRKGKARACQKADEKIGDVADTDWAFRWVWSFAYEQLMNEVTRVTFF
jgi:hypothetical protein